MPTITIQTGEFTQEFDCDDEGILREEIKEFLAKYDAKDYSIVDSEEFQGIDVRKYDLERICVIANCIKEDYTEGGFPIWYLEHDEGYTDTFELMDKFTEQFQGEYDSREDWAEQYWEDTGFLRDIPENLQGYIDYGAYARDCELGGDISFVDIPGSGGVYVFSNH